MALEVPRLPALDGIKVVEMGGPPGGFAAMVLADHGAQVLKIARPTPGASVGAGGRVSDHAAYDRGKRSVAIDVRSPSGAEALLRLLDTADLFVEGHRPGVAERLGVGPDVALARNQRLVYGRMTGFGQQGAWAGAAGHDIDYVALSGALHMIGLHDGPPVVPVNLVGDWAGGLLMAFGLLLGLHHARATGEGQVVDAAMLDTAALLSTVAHSGLSQGSWVDERASNMVDGGWPCYGVYETADGKHVAIGALEPQFYAALIDRMGLADAGLPAQHDRERWPELRKRLAERFRERSRDEWCVAMEGADACFAPVLGLGEARLHVHNVSRATFVDHDGVVVPAPAPRLSATPAALRPWVMSDVPYQTTLADWGFDDDEIAALTDLGVGG